MASEMESRKMRSTISPLPIALTRISERTEPRPARQQPTTKPMPAVRGECREGRKAPHRLRPAQPVSPGVPTNVKFPNELNPGPHKDGAALTDRTFGSAGDLVAGSFASHACFRNLTCL